jgi:hypothetical protein
MSLESLVAIGPESTIEYYRHRQHPRRVRYTNRKWEMGGEGFEPPTYWV